MPLKRTPRTMRETAASRALRAAVAEAEADMMARIPRVTKPTAKKTARAVERTLAKARAKWDAATPEWRAKRAAKILAELRRYESGAALPADGGRDLYAIRKLHRAPVSAPDLYEGHRAPVALAPITVDETPAPAPGAAAVIDELAERRKTRKRPRAGRAGYIDPRLFDADDWED